MPSKRISLIFACAALTVVAAALTTALLHSGSASAQAGSAGGSNPTVSVGDNWFCAPQFSGDVCETTISVGDSVTWNFSSASGTHSTTECGASCTTPSMTPLWNSGFVSDGSSFQHTFDAPGTYLYHCMVHPSQMKGRIIVVGEPAPTATPTSSPPPGATATPLPARPGDVDCSGSVNSIDAALVLQFSAALLHSLSCPQNGDLNMDGHTNSLDAALILQHAAGLI